MPLILNPDSTYDVVLSTDRDKPAGEQPVFVFQYLSGRKWKKIAELSDAFDDSKNSFDTINLAFDAIRVGLTGWRNMIDPSGTEIPYDPKLLDEILTPDEAVELMQAAVSQGPSLEDKKKLDLPSDSDTEKSVEAAEG